MTIRLKFEDAANGFFTLAFTGQTARLPNNTYVVGQEHLKLLKRAKTRYKVIDT